ncbi:MAG: LuxR C-terminal-related transcriptional regulator [Gordonibacter sp.]|uniref:response regulator transcription factor n=1 Tax=Gordonibacter sp. TaxID=1968902 RepID=UPI002FC81CDB
MFDKQYGHGGSDLHTTSFTAFKTIFLSGFSIAFFGIGLMRLWYQFNFYNLHFSADYGFVTVGANIVRVLVMALLVFLSYRTGFSHASKTFFVWSGLILMTLSGLFYLVDLFFGTTSFEVARFIIGGIGLVGGEIIWVFFLERLKPAEAFFYAAGGLALSCFLSLLAGYLSHEVFGLLNLFIPALSVFAYWRAMDLWNKGKTPSVRQAKKSSFSQDMMQVQGQSIGEEKVDFLYSTQLRGYLFSILSAFFLYAFLLGMALGYPDGRIRELSQAMRTIHQLLVIAVIVATVWWVLVRGRGFSLTGFWSFVNLLMIIGITFLMGGWPGSEEIATFFITNAITCFYIPLVFFIYLIGRHVGKSTVLVYGFVYGGALLAMSIGRIVVYQVGPYLKYGLWLLICMVFVALIEMVLVVYPRPNVRYPIGFELRAVSKQAAPMSIPPSGAATVANDVFASFAEAFQLTATETEIVRLLAQGRSRTVIAETLHYSENTVRNYVRVLYRKVGVHTKQELLDCVEQSAVSL